MEEDVAEEVRKRLGHLEPCPVQDRSSNGDRSPRLLPVALALPSLGLITVFRKQGVWAGQPLGSVHLSDWGGGGRRIRQQQFRLEQCEWGRLPHEPVPWGQHLHEGGGGGWPLQQLAALGELQASLYEQRSLLLH